MMLRNPNLAQYMERSLKYLNNNIAIMSYLFIIALLRFRNLGHKTITYWDELFHAIVSRNIMKHFFVPTLYENPYLNFSYTDWTQNHIWLHKPILPLWQISISYLIFGINPFALRFPSAILSSLSVLITYMIGVELYDKKVGFMAAFLQAFNPLMINLVHGYVFSDHIDISLIFWVELSCYLLIKGIKTGMTKYYVWSGVAQGFGYLSKSYLCLAVFGIAISILILTRTGFLKPLHKPNISIRKIAIQVLSSVLVATPWVMFCLIEYTKEFIHENRMVMTHLYDEVEIWRKPWDCHLFEYMPDHYPDRYLMILVSFVFLLVSALKQRKLSDMYIVLWIVGIVAPLSLSVSKVHAGTDIATPALLICFASVFIRIMQGNYGISAVVYFAAFFSVLFFSQWPIRLVEGLGESVGVVGLETMENLAPSLYNNPGILCQVACCFAILTCFAIAYKLSGAFRKSLALIEYKKISSVLILPLIILLAYPFIMKSVEITNKIEVSYDDYNSKGYYMGGVEDIGGFINENLPANSAILMESTAKRDSLYLMFYADRSVYQLAGDRSGVFSDEMVSMMIRNGGGLPFLVSRNYYEYPCLFRSPIRPFYGIYVLM